MDASLHHTPYSLSLDTILGTSSLIGHDLEGCQLIRDKQDAELTSFIASQSASRLRDETQQQLFAVAPLDILVTDHNAEKRFHIIELNGTGIGGLTNMSYDAVAAVMRSMEQLTHLIDKPNPLIIIGSSGMETAANPRLNKQIYEKLLYADAMRTGFLTRYGQACVTTMAQATSKPEILQRQAPTVIVGYMREILAAVTCVNGRLFLGNRQVDALVNDRMCLNLLHQFNYEVDLAQLLILNRTYLAGADKGVAYGMLNDYLEANPNPYFPRAVFFEHAATRHDLVAQVVSNVRAGRQIVIKPRGTGLGHGIEFFLDPHEGEAAITARIEQSLSLTEQYYGLRGGALPYTLCEFIDTSCITAESHPMRGHKFELRVVVYRDGMELKAFPSIVKISSQAFDPNNISRMMLINNITASVSKTKLAGSHFKVPLSNWEVLDVLGIRREHLLAVCTVATGFVRSLLDRCQDRPQEMGLPFA